jgi:hypothetical protein
MVIFCTECSLSSITHPSILTTAIMHLLLLLLVAPWRVFSSSVFSSSTKLAGSPTMTGNKQTRGR